MASWKPELTDTERLVAWAARLYNCIGAWTSEHRVIQRSPLGRLVGIL
jgi:hypothetical protein